MERAMSAQF
jgi:hypothetical protein